MGFNSFNLCMDTTVYLAGSYGNSGIYSVHAIGSVKQDRFANRHSAFGGVSSIYVSNGIVYTSVLCDALITMLAIDRNR